MAPTTSLQTVGSLPTPARMRARGIIRRSCYATIPGVVAGTLERCGDLATAEYVYVSADGLHHLDSLRPLCGAHALVMLGEWRDVAIIR